MAYRTYCRVAAVVFLLFTAYPVVTKVLEDRLSHDWLHSALHLGSAAAATYAGWFARTDTPARLFTWGVAVVYGGLGTVGWFIDGLLLNTHLAIPLGPVDNAFHLGLAAFAITAIIRTRAAATGSPTARSGSRA